MRIDIDDYAVKIALQDNFPDLIGRRLSRVVDIDQFLFAKFQKILPGFVFFIASITQSSTYCIAPDDQKRIISLVHIILLAHSKTLVEKTNNELMTFIYKLSSNLKSINLSSFTNLYEKFFSGFEGLSDKPEDSLHDVKGANELRLAQLEQLFNIERYEIALVFFIATVREFAQIESREYFFPDEKINIVTLVRNYFAILQWRNERVEENKNNKDIVQESRVQLKITWEEAINKISGELSVEKITEKKVKICNGVEYHYRELGMLDECSERKIIEVQFLLAVKIIEIKIQLAKVFFEICNKKIMLEKDFLMVNFRKKLDSFFNELARISMLRASLPNVRIVSSLDKYNNISVNNPLSLKQDINYLAIKNSLLPKTFQFIEKLSFVFFQGKLPPALSNLKLELEVIRSDFYDFTNDEPLTAESYAEHLQLLKSLVDDIKKITQQVKSFTKEVLEAEIIKVEQKKIRGKIESVELARREELIVAAQEQKLQRSIRAPRKPDVQNNSCRKFFSARVPFRSKPLTGSTPKSLGLY